MIGSGALKLTALVASTSLFLNGVGLMANEVLDRGTLSVGFTVSLVCTVVVVLRVLFKERMEIEKRLDANDSQNREIWREVRTLGRKPADPETEKAALGEPPNNKQEKP